MDTNSLTLALDLGPTRTNGAFRVRLDAEKLQDLIRATEDARRIYELMLIERPGDVLDYVWVVLEELSQSVRERIDDFRHQHGSAQRIWPGDRMPLGAFDHLFYWAAEDTDADDETWLRFRNSAQMRSFMHQAYANAIGAQNRLAWGDALERHVYSRIRAGVHPYCYIGRDAARHKCESPTRADVSQHTNAFYEKLSQLLRDPEIASVAYRASGDYRVFRMMATEQRRRASFTGHTTRNALFLSALSNHSINQLDWDCAILFFDEGLGYGDLLIQGHGIGSDNIRKVMQSGHRPPRRYLLTTGDIGGIDGFDQLSGDGWVLYTKQQPSTRRQSLHLVQYLRFDRETSAGPILSFAGSGSTVFHQDKAVIVVGAEVPQSASAALASIIAAWQQDGGDPLVLVLGDTTPFDLAGCKGTLQVPPGAIGDKQLMDWLFKTLQLSRPWIDVVLSLHAPKWVQELLANMLDDFERPWKAWVAAAGDESWLTVDCRLEGELAQVLVDSAHRARATRPKSM